MYGYENDTLYPVSEGAIDTIKEWGKKVLDFIREQGKKIRMWMHNVAVSIKNFFKKDEDKSYQLGAFKDTPKLVTDIGKGVTGIVNGSKVIAGNRYLMESENIDLKDFETESNNISIFVSENGKLIGRVLLADTLRENSKETIRNLKKLQIKTTLLTGDNEKTAKYIANEVKVRNVKFNCLPEDKTNYIKEEQLLGHEVAMIGDGVNDAPSLKKANVGIAMGKIGSEISVEAANITLINDILNPIEGALIHNIGSVAVIIYSSTLTKYRISKRDYNKSKNVVFYKKTSNVMN